jgi:malic enzyme
MGGAAAVVTKVFKKEPKPAPVAVAPTVAEVSQSQAADAYDPRSAMARGRSSTIITGSKGVEDESLTLGKKSLLGQ